MKAILEAYKQNVELPDYIVNQIVENIPRDEKGNPIETIWSFSNAISYVRTHGELKVTKRSLPREHRSLTFKLDRIAAEIISLTPTIIDLKSKVGEITKEILLKPPKEVYR